MIDISKFRFGDTIYVVEEQNNMFFRQKIYMTDADGFEWLRYDRPNYGYSICEIVYCGKVIMIVSGDVDLDNIYETEHHFKYDNGKRISYEYENDFPNLENWFATKEEAEAYAAAESVRKNA